MTQIKESYEKYKRFLYYGISGVLTTLINITVYWIAAHLFGIKTVPSSVIAWIAAVLFAYFTNRKWVFCSGKHAAADVTIEALTFFACRLGTGIFDWLFMYITVDCLHWNDMWMKFTANVLVIVLNYLAARLIVFKKGLRCKDV